MKNSKSPIQAIMVAALVAAPVGASAGNTTSTMTARAKIDTSCRLNTEPLQFGMVNVFSGVVDTTARVRLACGPSIAYSVTIDNGQYYNGQRRMYGGTWNGFQLYLPYQIYQNAARTQPWGATPATRVNGTTPANGLVTLTAYGRLPSSIVLPRAYADVVTITVDF